MDDSSIYRHSCSDRVCLLFGWVVLCLLFFFFIVGEGIHISDTMLTDVCGNLLTEVWGIYSVCGPLRADVFGISFANIGFFWVTEVPQGGKCTWKEGVSNASVMGQSLLARDDSSRDSDVVATNVRNSLDDELPTYLQACLSIIIAFL